MQIQLRNRRIVHVRDAVPGICPQAIHDSAIVRDQVRGSTLWRLGGDVADIDAAGEAPAHRDEPIAVAHDPGRLGKQHANLREAAREHEMLDDLEKRRLVVEIRLEIGGVNRDQALSGRGDFVHCRACLGDGAQYREGFGSGGACFPRRVHGLGRIARVRELRESASCIAFPGSVHERCPFAPAFIGRLRDLSQEGGARLSSRSRFGVRIRTQSPEIAGQFAFPPVLSPCDDDPRCGAAPRCGHDARRPGRAAPHPRSDLAGQPSGDARVLRRLEGFEAALLGIRQG